MDLRQKQTVRRFDHTKMAPLKKRRSVEKYSAVCSKRRTNTTERTPPPMTMCRWPAVRVRHTRETTFSVANEYEFYHPSDFEIITKDYFASFSNKTKYFIFVF